MDFEQLLAFLEGHLGKMVEVSIGLPGQARRQDEEDAFFGVACFSGRLRSIQPSRAGGPGSVVVYLQVDAPLPTGGEFWLRRSLYRSATVEAEPVSEPDEREGTGTLWVLRIDQDGPPITVTFYV